MYKKQQEVLRQKSSGKQRTLNDSFEECLKDNTEEINMERFLNKLSANPDIAALPIVADSSKFHIVETALRCLQGKSIVNSISLKEGEKVFLEQVRRNERKEKTKLSREM